MGDDLQTWRSRIGSFVHPPGCKFKSSSPHQQSCFIGLISLSVRCCLLMLLVVSMTVERNPGPKTPPATRTEERHYNEFQPGMSGGTPNPSSPFQKTAYQILQRAKRSPMKTRKRRMELTFSDSPLKHLSPEKQKRPSKGLWSEQEDKFLVLFFGMNGEWDASKLGCSIWKEACTFLASKVKGAPRTEKAVRSRVVNTLKKQPLKELVEKYGFTDILPNLREDLPDTLNMSTRSQIEVAIKALKNMTKEDLKIFAVSFATELDDNLEPLETITDALFSTLTTKKGLNHSVRAFVQNSSNAMVRLQEADKPNIILKLAEVIHPDPRRSAHPLMPLNRMPFGLVQYQIEFFHCTNSDQVRNMPPDFRRFQEMMEIEFGTRFNKLFRGPAWSGLPRDDWKDPQKARMNVACNSHATVARDIAKSDYTTNPELQIPALEQLKKTNPQGRFWIKLDATDIRPALQESVKGVWNGDPNLLDGQLEKLRAEYDERLAACNNPTSQSIILLSEKFIEDRQYLKAKLSSAAELLKKKTDDVKTKDEKLKELSWEVVEISNLLDQAGQFVEAFKGMTGSQADLTKHRGLKEDIALYFKGLFKKKRQPAASHVLVIMASEERRNSKPYSLPIQYIPYHSITGDRVLVYVDKIKKKMVELGMTCIGLVTDGEFSTLRTKGRERPTHLYEVIRQARGSVTNKSKAALEAMLLKKKKAANGNIIVAKPDAIPQHVLKRFNKLREEGVAYKEALQLIRASTVPKGQKPRTWRANSDHDTTTELLKSIVASYRLRNKLDSYKKNGIDFTMNLHIPEVDNITNDIFYNREDHNHILKRIGFHTRKAGNTHIDLARFHEAMASDKTDLHYHALIGTHKQSVEDAERLVSHAMANFFKEKGYIEEEQYVRTIALWHEASDGRGLSPAERSAANNRMLKMILDEWIPGHADGDTLMSFYEVDVNVRLKGICGFSRETVIAVTTNSISQELRREFNLTLGPEHPRAGTTDDVECFFALLHRMCGGVHVTLKDFKYWWQKLVRQFINRIDPSLPFYFWTSSDRFHLEEASFDEVPVVQNGERTLTRLHKLRRKSRLDSSIIAPGRTVMPKRYDRSLRQSLYAFAVGLPPVSSDKMQEHIRRIMEEESKTSASSNS